MQYLTMYAAQELKSVPRNQRRDRKKRRIIQNRLNQKQRKLEGELQQNLCGKAQQMRSSCLAAGRRKSLYGLLVLPRGTEIRTGILLVQRGSLDQRLRLKSI